MRDAFGIAFIGAIILCTLWLDQRDYDVAYSQGRVDKNAEMMQAMTGDPTARIAVMTEDKVLYHEASTCAVCHTS